MKSIHLKKIFLLDGFGAMLSAFILGIVLVKLESIFGIPKISLYFLASLPFLFAVYDLYVYFNINENLEKYLKVIAIFNIIYCCISIGIAFYNFQLLTAFGWIYILIEVLIIAFIAKMEFNAVSNFRKNLL